MENTLFYKTGFEKHFIVSIILQLKIQPANESKKYSLF